MQFGNHAARSKDRSRMVVIDEEQVKMNVEQINDIDSRTRTKESFFYKEYTDEKNEYNKNTRIYTDYNNTLSVKKRNTPCQSEILATSSDDSILFTLTRQGGKDRNEFSMQKEHNLDVPEDLSVKTRDVAIQTDFGVDDLLSNENVKTMLSQIVNSILHGNNGFLNVLKSSSWHGFQDGSATKEVGSIELDLFTAGHSRLFLSKVAKSEPIFPKSLFICSNSVLVDH